MDCTPDSVVHLQKSKKHLNFGSSADSGYSGALSFSGKPSGAKCAPCRFVSSEDYNETPKENLSVTPKKERPTETSRLSGNDGRRVPQLSAVGWCETPKVPKKDGSLRRRLQMCNAKSATEAKDEAPTSPRTKAADARLRLGPKHLFSGSSVSPDSPFESLSSSTLKAEQACRSPLSTRKRRLFYAQVKTSTHEYDARNIRLSAGADLSGSLVSSGRCATGQPETPRSVKFLHALESENCLTPVHLVAASPGLCPQNTPSAALTPTFVRSLSEDSGFGSVAHDKSQDSAGEHDGSFQELPSSSGLRAGAEAPHLSEGKRRSRLARQQRLSTLREGGSQSEEDQSGHARPGGKPLSPRRSPCKADEVFLLADDTPSGSAGALMPGHLATPRSPFIAKQDAVTPLCMAAARRDTPTGRTPVWVSPAGQESLSLTPALQLVRAMCLRKASLVQDRLPSFELELRSVKALVDSPEALRTSMPLAGLIGRKMGVGKLDVLTELKKRHLRHVLSVVLGHLSPEDVLRFGQVCPSWEEIIVQDRRARGRRRSHLRELEHSLEQGVATPVRDAGTRLALTKRAVLGSIQAQSRSLTYCTPQSAKSTLTPSQLNTSHSGGSKREKYIQVAKTLFSDECLRPCPRCQHPAKCHPVKMEGVCSRADCRFQFCTGCLCAFHGGRECLSLSAGRHVRRDTVAPGSAQSKRNLRRL